MSSPIRFCFVLHDHQPVGNFDHVFEQSYQDSYLPFLNVFERYGNLKMGLHTSGPLMEWLDAKHPEYLDRVRNLVAAGRIEIIGGAFYEPILAMIPPRDRVGQIRSFTQWLEQRLNCQVRGMWMPERVWEQNMASDLVTAGVQYTMLDDFHFKSAGLTEDQLHGYYVTEDNGHVLSVFPDSEPLRYLIPFSSPESVIDYLRHVATVAPGGVAFFGDDGEKLGAWPETKRTVYDEGWLTRFFDLLCANQHWIQSATPAEVLDSHAPLDKVYLPECSYREMTEWALPSERLTDYLHIRKELEQADKWARVQRFIRGSSWRNFKVKYPESDEMYSRMMLVSKRLAELEESGVHGEHVDAARACLYRGQCNCGYWHGAFGGTYLPHLRNAVFNQLIAADNLLDKATGRNSRPWVEAITQDCNFDGRQEVILSNNRLVTILAPSRGGQMYELDVRQICQNLLATLTRRAEAYHRQVLAGEGGKSDIASVSDRVIFKQAGLDSRLQYDLHPRKSLLDHFYDVGVPLGQIVRGEARELGDFLARPYETRLRRNPDRIQVQMTAQGFVDGSPIKITKGVTLEANSATLEIAYLLEGLHRDRPLHFSPELNFAAMPAGADDRYFHQGSQRLGQLGQQLDLQGVSELALCDEWLGLDVQLGVSRPTAIWTFPIETVSQSEGGFELVHQSVVVQPHWVLEPDAEGRWGVTMTLTLDTQLAESRAEKHLALAEV
jgi:alpha-amylase